MIKHRAVDNQDKDIFYPITSKKEKRRQKSALRCPNVCDCKMKTGNRSTAFFPMEDSLDKKRMVGISSLLRLGVAQFGSVLEWGSRGRKFESSHPDHRKPPKFRWFFIFMTSFVTSVPVFLKNQPFLCYVLLHSPDMRLTLIPTLGSLSACHNFLKISL